MLLLALTACARPAPSSCTDDLAGIWHTPAGDWHVFPGGRDKAGNLRLEAYPIYDAHLTAYPEGLEVGPPAIDLLRTGDQLTGTLSQRFMQRDVACIAKQPLVIRGCTAAGLDLDVPTLVPPTLFVPCTFPTPLPPTPQRWTFAR